MQVFLLSKPFLDNIFFVIQEMDAMEICDCEVHQARFLATASLRSMHLSPRFSWVPSIIRVPCSQVAEDDGDCQDTVPVFHPSL